MLNRRYREMAMAPDADEAALARGARRRGMAHELAEIGLRLARRVAEAAEVVADDGAAGSEIIANAGLAYSRIAGAVRLTLGLEALIDGDVLLQAERLRAEKAARAAKAAKNREIEHEEAILTEVRRAIRAQVGEPRDRNALARLFADLDEALADEDDWEVLFELPIAEAAARICRDLGVDFDPAPWSDEGDEDDEISGSDDSVGDNTDDPPDPVLITASQAATAAHPPPDANGHRPP